MPIYPEHAFNWSLIIRGPIAKTLKHTLLPSVYERALQHAGAHLGLGGQATFAVESALDMLETAAAEQKLPETDEDVGSWQAFGAVARDQYGQFAAMHRKHPNIKADKKLVEECGLLVTPWIAISVAGTRKHVEEYMRCRQFQEIARIRGAQEAYIPQNIGTIGVGQTRSDYCVGFNECRDYMPTALSSNKFQFPLNSRVYGIPQCEDPFLKARHNSGERNKDRHK